jgi:ammonia channel protein AmtB
VVLVIIVAGGAAWIMFAVLAHKGLLRVDQVTELAGIDNMDHGEESFSLKHSFACRQMR